MLTETFSTTFTSEPRERYGGAFLLDFTSQMIDRSDANNIFNNGYVVLMDATATTVLGCLKIEPAEMRTARQFYEVNIEPTFSG